MVYRTATTPLFTLRREVDRLFEDATAYLFELELPGVAPADVEVNSDGGVLTVTGEKRAERRESDEGKWHIVERISGSFRRTFQLPQNVREEGIEARFANGMLSVRVPKAEVPTPKKIEVRTG